MNLVIAIVNGGSLQTLEQDLIDIAIIGKEKMVKLKGLKFKMTGEKFVQMWKKLFSIRYTKQKKNAFKYYHLKTNASPMLKKYPEMIAPSVEIKFGPSNKTLNAILNYSKALEVKKIKMEKVLIHLN